MIKVFPSFRYFIQEYMSCILFISNKGLGVLLLEDTVIVDVATVAANHVNGTIILYPLALVSLSFGFV